MTEQEQDDEGIPDMEMSYGSPVLTDLDRAEARRTSQDFRYQIYGSDIRAAYRNAFPEGRDVATYIALLLQESSLRRFHSCGDATEGLARGIAQYKGLPAAHTVSIPRMLRTSLAHLKSKGWDGTASTLTEAYGKYGLGDAGYERDVRSGSPQTRRIVRLLLSKRPKAMAYAAEKLYNTSGVPSWFTAIDLLNGIRSADRMTGDRDAWREGRTLAARSNGVDKVNPVQPIARLLFSTTRLAFPGGSTGTHRDARRQVIVPRGRSLGGHNGGVAVDIAADSTASRPRAVQLMRKLVRFAPDIGIVTVQYSKLRWVATPENVWQSVDDNDHFNHLHVEVKAGPAPEGAEAILRRIVEEIV